MLREMVRTPRPASPLIGRAELMARVAELMREGERLVTLVGPAGSGKTRLAIELAAVLRRPGGVRFVDVTDVDDESGLQAAVAHAYGRGAPGPGGSIVPLLQTLPASLLVLDNFEHLVRIGAAVGEWVVACPDLQVLITSRERLHAEGERTIEVPPLSLPRPGEDGEAFALWTALRRRTDERYHVAEEREDVVALMELLDGLPLAIELAAKRAPLLGARGLRDRIADRLHEPRAGSVPPPGDGPFGRFTLLRDRDATLLGALEWSWSLLDDEESLALAVLSLFRGGFDVESAEAVLASTSRGALDLVGALRDKSLLVVASARDGSLPRIGMLLCVRELAQRKLAARPDRAVWVARFVTHFARFAEQCMVDYESSRPDAAVAAIRREVENLRAAAQWALDLDAFDLALARELVFVLEAWNRILRVRGPIDAQVDLVDRLVAWFERHAPADPALGRVLELRALARVVGGRDVLRAIDELGRAIAVADHAAAPVAQRVDHRTSLAFALGVVREPERAETCLDQAEALLAELDDPWRCSKCAIIRGDLFRDRRRLDDAEQSYRRAVRWLELCGRERDFDLAWLGLALIARERGDVETVRHAVVRLLHHQERFEDRYSEGIVRTVGALAEHAAGALSEARALYRAVLPLHRAFGQPMLEGLTLGYDGLAAFEQGDRLGGLERLDAAIVLLERIGAAAHRRLFVAQRTLALWVDGRRVEARARAFEETQRRGPSVLDQAVLDAWLAEAFEGRAPAFGEESLSFDLRIAHRLLQKIDATSAAADRGVVAWRIERRGRFVVDPAGRRVELSRRPVMRRLVMRLAVGRFEAPGTAVTSEELVEVGWPDEVSSKESGRNRLYVTVRRMRELGLSLIVSSEGGYALDPAAEVRWD
jgi:predicted ATPase